MPRLHVCPLSHLPETVAASSASHLVTLVNAGTPMERPAAIPPERHLVVSVSDIVAAQEGHILADEAHVRRFLDFVRAWDRARPLVIHCYAGVSRSTAAAFVAACALAPEREEAEVARALRRASPTATPNARIVALADRLLGREGRMVAAVAAIGRGAECFSGAPFQLALEA